MFVFDKRIFILEAWDDRPQRHAHELSLEGDVLSDIHLPDEHLSTISQKYGQWMIAYNDRTRGREWLTVFSLAGESLVSIDGLEGFPQMIPRGGHEYYLLGRHLVRYDSQTLQHEDLGLAPWDLPIYRGACGGLHFLTEAWQTRLLALRDAGGRGLEEVWRIDFAESDRHVGWQGRVPGQVNFLNLYGDDAWISTHVRTYRVDIRTGQIRAVRARFLPEFLVEGGIGYALCPGEFRAIDMARGILLREGPRLSFPLGGGGAPLRLRGSTRAGRDPLRLGVAVVQRAIPAGGLRCAGGAVRVARCLGRLAHPLGAYPRGSSDRLRRGRGAHLRAGVGA